jgi:hypothetical protein
VLGRRQVAGRAPESRAKKYRAGKADCCRRRTTKVLSSDHLYPFTLDPDNVRT